MQSIGYRHMCEYISGRLDYVEAVSMLKQDTRRLAKRQLTWFRGQEEAESIQFGSFTPEVERGFLKKVSYFLKS